MQGLLCNHSFGGIKKRKKKENPCFESKSSSATDPWHKMENWLTTPNIGALMLCLGLKWPQSD